MWHEARKQERRIRGLIVDYRKRAERRQDFYEKIQADPTQFIQVHGRRCKIHLDPAVAAAGDGAAIIVPWQGQQDNLIDRFDVRAHLDYIPPVAKTSTEGGHAEPDISQEERQLNYERYRILAQNDFLNVSEDKFLHQLNLEEQFGANAQLEAERNLGKKKQKTGGATIGYSYEESGESSGAMGPQPFGHLMNVPAAPPAVPMAAAGKTEKEGGSDDSDSDMDMDVSIDIAKLDTAQAHELNACGRNYGMKINDFFSYLTKDADEADALRIAREEEQEKMLLSGRKSRRERRAQKERRIANRPFSPPSYAAKEEQGKANKDEDSESRSPSPADGGTEKITYITSFGGEDEMQPHSKITINIAKPGQTLGESCISASSGAAGPASSHITYAQKVKDNLEKLKLMNEASKRSARRHSFSKSRSPSRSQSRSVSRSRSGSRNRRRSRRRSYHRRSRTRSRHRHRYRYSRSRSPSWRRSRSSSYKRSRKRYSYSSRSSSGSSYGSSRRRRSRSRTRSPSTQRNRMRTAVKKKASTPPPTLPAAKTLCVSTTTTTTTMNSTITATLVPTVSAVPPMPLPPMISYPLSTRVMAAKAATVLPQVVEPPPPPLKRYYGRKRGDDTSSSSSPGNSEASDAEEQQPPTLQTAKTLRVRTDRDDSDELDVDSASERSHSQAALSSSTITGNQSGKYSSATETKGSGQCSSGTSASVGRPNLRERLKRKMQNLLNRQYKADKRAEIEKSERERQQQQVREDEMRELALKLRRRRRELRHKYGTPSSGKVSDSEVESTHSEPQVKPNRSSERRSRSRSRKRSPAEPQQQKPTPSSTVRQHRRSSSRTERRHRSPSRDRRQHARSHSRRSASRDRRHSRSRRSTSRRRRRDRSIERNRVREQERYRHYERARGRDRGISPPPRSSNYGSSSGVGGGYSGNRGRVVISAPPKLKKLVDY